jgi:hypothetical protein
MDTFVDEHPGGAKILKRVGGKDASKQFWKVCCIYGRVHTVDGADAGLLVSQRERVEEVRAQAESRNGQGGGKAIIIPIQRSLDMILERLFALIRCSLKHCRDSISYGEGLSRHEGHVVNLYHHSHYRKRQ